MSNVTPAEGSGPEPDVQEPDQQYATDGGYVIDTGDNYAGVWRVTSGPAAPIATTSLDLPWSVDDELVITDVEEGIAVCSREAATSGVITTVTVDRPSGHPAVRIPKPGLDALGVSVGDDIRGYYRSEGGLLLVPRTADPRVSSNTDQTDAGGDQDE